MRKRVELSTEENQRAMQRRTETAKVAHELRTPLASLQQFLGVLKLLGNNEKDLKKTRDYIQIMTVQAEILFSLVNGLLTME